jgi:replicative DNA helicase
VDLASAVFKQIIDQQDLAAWTSLRRNYLSSEYNEIYDRIASFLDRFNKIPSFEELKFDAKGKRIQQKIAVIEKVEVEAEAEILIEFLKSDYAQEVTFNNIDRFIQNSTAFDKVTDTVEHLQGMIVDLEEKIDMDVDQENMQTIELFEPEESMDNRLALGLNSEFDTHITFSPEDLILIGGRRGAGKSLVCSNLAANAYNQDQSSIYFTIEMTQREILQRVASIGAGVSHYRLKNRLLSTDEIQKLAKWWSSRYEGGLDYYMSEYDLSMSFDELHTNLTKLPLRTTRFDIVYDPELTVARIRAELERKVNIIQPKVIVVDYINQIKLTKFNPNPKKGQYDWDQQIQISKFLKSMAQKYNVPIVSPYQIDSTGEARFSKGILDSADAVFTLDPHEKEDACMSFNCTKMRSFAETDFTSHMDWETLKIGPEAAIVPDREEAEEEAEDLPWN